MSGSKSGDDEEESSKKPSDAAASRPMVAVEASSLAQEQRAAGDTIRTGNTDNTQVPSVLEVFQPESGNVIQGGQTVNAAEQDPDGRDNGAGHRIPAPTNGRDDGAGHRTIPPPPRREGSTKQSQPPTYRGEGLLKSSVGSRMIPPRPKSVDGHRRGISWSDQLGAGDIPSLQQPRLSFEESPQQQQRKMTSSEQSSSRPGHTKFSSDLSSLDMDLDSPNVSLTDPSPPVVPAPVPLSRIPSSYRKIELDDVLKTSPFESEAESCIISALEERDPTIGGVRARLETASSILSRVPVGSENAFSPRSSDSDTGSRNSANGAPLSPDDSRERRSSQTSATFAGSRQCVGTAESAGSRMRTETTGVVKDSPSLISQPSRRTIEKRAQQSPKPSHKRQKTMEETLAGLTNALVDIQGHNRKYSSGSSTGPPELQKVESDVVVQPGVPTSSAETLAHNANILLRKRKPESFKADTPVSISDKASASQSGSEKSASNHWGVLKAAIYLKPQDRKKHDGDEDQEDSQEDVESGRPSPENSPEVPTTDSSGSEEQGGRRRTKKPSLVTPRVAVVSEFFDFISPKRRTIFLYTKAILLLMIPATGVAFILYYVADNPPTGTIDLDASKNGTLINNNNDPVDPSTASASWWILFICVRQVVTFSLARAMQVFIIDFVCLGRRLSLSFFGPMITLLIVQSRGWPFVCFFWAAFNFVLLYGTHPFASHWLYFQDLLGVFNGTNPSGGITSSSWYERILIIAISVAAVVSVKRMWIGFYLGKKTFSNYAEELAKVMKKIILLSEVAGLAKEFEREQVIENGRIVRSRATQQSLAFSKENFDGLVNSAEDEESDVSPSVHTLNPDHSDLIIDIDQKDRMTGGLTHSQKMKLVRLLGSWEEPEKEGGSIEDISISAILQFRQTLSYMDSPFVFSFAFGLADTREHTIVSAQEVYLRLLLRTPDTDVLSFDALAPLGIESDGSLNTEKLKDLIRVLRPDRDGNLTLLDFVKSVDAVYKQLRLLRAAVKNSQKIDRAFERIFNVGFYVVMICIIISRLGFDPLALFLSLSSIILAFAFMIGSASAKYFEGLLFILVRRPYDIGDRIHVSGVESEGNPHGSASWFVKDINLFTTTVMYAATNERATLSNGSLANSRIINGARSPKALLYVTLKFGIEVPYHKIEIFQEALVQFVKARPREWVNLNGFRATNIQADLGYIEYLVILQHRDSWQNVIPLRVSTAAVQSFCLELSKQLDMRYKSPKLPVDLTIAQPAVEEGSDQGSIVAKLAGLTADSDDIRKIAEMFEKRT